jgi:hypothetical protein
LIPIRKPNFFIVGAAKSGTTTLWKYLSQIVQVYMPMDEMVKEPGFFSDLANHGRRTQEQYLDLFLAA